jgi:hypothetical protein
MKILIVAAFVLALIAAGYLFRTHIEALLQWEAR